MTTQTPGFYLLNDTYQLISNQMLLFIGYSVSFGGVKKRDTTEKKFGASLITIEPLHN
jgi:hypothetical protein